MTAHRPGRQPDHTIADLLLVAAGRGDQETFGAFYDCTVAGVFGTLSAVLGDGSRAEHATHDVYLQMWCRAPSFDPAARSASTTMRLLILRAIVAGTYRPVSREAPGATASAPWTWPR